jgi:hypothetical protein
MIKLTRMKDLPAAGLINRFQKNLNPSITRRSSLVINKAIAKILISLSAALELRKITHSKAWTCRRLMAKMRVKKRRTRPAVESTWIIKQLVVSMTAIWVRLDKARTCRQLSAANHLKSAWISPSFTQILSFKKMRIIMEKWKHFLKRLTRNRNFTDLCAI